MDNMATMYLAGKTMRFREQWMTMAVLVQNAETRGLRIMRQLQSVLSQRLSKKMWMDVSRAPEE
jgi:hypothetical protein